MRTTMLQIDPLTPGTCEWCGKPTELENVACSLSCEALLRRQEAQQGLIVLRHLKRWRKHRGRKGTPGEGAMTEVATMVDGFLRADRQRREQAATKRRAAEAKAAGESAPPPPSEPPVQTAAPVTDRPE